MLLRHWFTTVERPSTDIDLVSLDEFDVQRATEALTPLLHVDRIDDGVQFDTERWRVQPIWMDTDFPGIRMIALATVNAQLVAFSVDITFGESLVPEPMFETLESTAAGAIEILACRPEAILARKLQALSDMALQHWRPKDLNDIWHLLESRQLDRRDLVDAIHYSFNSRGSSACAARDMFGEDSWWKTQTANARWRDFSVANRHCAGTALSQIVSDVAQQLVPVLGQL